MWKWEEIQELLWKKSVISIFSEIELALQFVNDRIYIEIEEKCKHTGKRYESLV